MPSKKKITLEDHLGWGVSLAGIAESALTLHLLLSRYFPINGKETRLAKKLHVAALGLKHVLEDSMMNDFPGKDTSCYRIRAKK